jgi:hypothetical protein
MTSTYDIEIWHTSNRCCRLIRLWPGSNRNFKRLWTSKLIGVSISRKISCRKKGYRLASQARVAALLVDWLAEWVSVRQVMVCVRDPAGSSSPPGSNWRVTSLEDRRYRSSPDQPWLASQTTVVAALLLLTKTPRPQIPKTPKCEWMFE